MLRDTGTSQHNVMLAKRKQLQLSPKTDQVAKGDRSAKRLRLSINEDVEATPDLENRPPSPSFFKSSIPDSEAESDSEEIHHATKVRKTDLETALPPIDEKAVIENYTIPSTEEHSSTPEQRLAERKWVPGKSSIYVDAFNLALDTVLQDESHLFDAAETALFQTWRDLTFEAQYLYVRLFLRKTSSWHRVNRLGYHSDIANLDIAIKDLLQVRSLPPPSELLPESGFAALEDSLKIGDSFTFADGSAEHITDLEEASSLLLLDELKTLAKDAKVQGKTKRELAKAFRKASSKQSGLGWTSLKRSDTEESAGSVMSGDFDLESRESTPSHTRDEHFMDKIFAITGPFVRLSLPVLKLFERVHLVFYRSTEWTEKSLTAIILARIARWTFPSYIVCRSTNIFPSRIILLEFEASLRLQFKVDSILEFNGPLTKDGIQTIIDIFEDVLPRWTALVEEEGQKEESIFASGEGAYLRRLSPAWVYTRILHKGAYVLGKLKEHTREHEILTSLLAQRQFHTARRGDWYQRKALLQEHYMHALSPTEGRSGDAAKKHWKRVALQTCEEGLQDPLVHLIYHHDLQKRIVKLEKSLRIPKREQHDFGHVRLAKPAERTFYGTQILRQERDREATQKGRKGSKTIWIDPGVEEGGGECSVEAMCLSQYRGLGYRGYHSEGGILRTLFAYLFYDVLFLYIPDVFQTAYQTCPLDLHTDAFYPSRISEMNQRLNEISNGGAVGIVQRVWDEHSEQRTCVVGLDWSFELGDLLSIAKCFPPAALSTVCKVVAQEYGQRGGGVPDLFLWREDEHDYGEIVFVEVKSQNDRLSDTQRLWIDVLSGAGIRVELCNALAKEVKVVER
ncbi:hypothetical protein AAFC00_001731 [Neodothiora populina]|uniref:Fanconi-associated nuclease n=1 Tax=Neodothiora populina TaxID=2781224 RepID=A0ABR3PQ42_9PEZI